MKEVSLTRGKVAIVDDVDFGWITETRWCAYGGGNTFYAERRVKNQDGRWILEKMHRCVLERKIGRKLVRGEYTDHMNGNGLDNRRDNLRVATASQNQLNRRKNSLRTSSKYIGVCWHKGAKKWMARIMVARKPIYLGLHLSEHDAAIARESFIQSHPELMASSNFSRREDK